MKVKRFLTTLLFLTSFALGLGVTEAYGQELRLNDVQVIGTHNSYHVAAQPEILEFIAGLKKEWRSALDYTHLPLDQQLTVQNVRQQADFLLLRNCLHGFLNTDRTGPTDHHMVQDVDADHLTRLS